MSSRQTLLSLVAILVACAGCAADDDDGVHWSAVRTFCSQIRAYREPYHRNRSLAFLPACMSTSGRIHSEFLRLLYLIADKQASDYFADLDYEPHKEEFCQRRGVFLNQHRSTIGIACAQAVAIRGAPDAARRHASARVAERSLSSGWPATA